MPKQTWRCSTESAKDSRFFHCNGDVNAKHCNVIYDRRTKEPIGKPAPTEWNPDYIEYELGSCNTVEAFDAADAAYRYCRDYLYDQFDETEFEIWVRNDNDEVWHCYAYMTDVEATGEDGEELTVDDMPMDPSEMEEAVCATFTPEDLEPWEDDED